MLGAEAKEKQKWPARAVLWMESEKAEYTPVKPIAREVPTIIFFHFCPLLVPVFPPAIPSCQNICDLYYMASKEEVLQ